MFPNILENLENEGATFQLLKMFEKIIRRSSCSLLSPCRLEKLLTVTAPCDGVSAKTSLKSPGKYSRGAEWGVTAHLPTNYPPPPSRVHLGTVDHWGEVIWQLGCNNDYILLFKVYLW